MMPPPGMPPGMPPPNFAMPPPGYSIPPPGQMQPGVPNMDGNQELWVETKTAEGKVFMSWYSKLTPEYLICLRNCI